jgi:hypothetical protein
VYAALVIFYTKQALKLLGNAVSVPVLILILCNYYATSKLSCVIKISNGSALPKKRHAEPVLQFERFLYVFQLAT